MKKIRSRKCVSCNYYVLKETMKPARNKKRETVMICESCHDRLSKAKK